MDYESDGEILDISSTFSTYDCINECIKNSFCYTATHLSKEKFNCYLKTKFDDKHTEPQPTPGQVFEIKGFLFLIIIRFKITVENFRSRMSFETCFIAVSIASYFSIFLRVTWGALKVTS